MLLSMSSRNRFSEYCYQVARFVAAQTDGVCYFTPVNEPSYFAWAGGEVGQFAPHRNGSGKDLKIALIAAAIRGIEAIWAACPRARIAAVIIIPCCFVAALVPPLSTDATLACRHCPPSCKFKNG